MGTLHVLTLGRASARSPSSVLPTAGLMASDGFGLGGAKVECLWPPQRCRVLLTPPRLQKPCGVWGGHCGPQRCTSVRPASRQPSLGTQATVLRIVHGALSRF